MFVDTARIVVKAGKGGDGIVAFRREKYVAKGGPSGGKGGKGGSVIFVGDSGLTTLLDFRYNRKIKAEDGQNGMNKDKFGADGKSVYVKVPIGTTIIDVDKNIIIGDIVKPFQEVVVCKGGKGGRGNAFFASPRHPAPDICEKGEPGEERNIELNLKVLADVGLVGFPSVGKSTLISVVSEAKPKIADYHFTTLIPNLGVVAVPDGRSFVMADLPGLIEGAHTGLGLGIQFLKHVERTRVIVHVIDMSAKEDRDPVSDYLKINKELESYNLDLLKRPQIIVANKMDMPGSDDNLERFKKELGIDNVIAISALTKNNLNELLYAVADKLEEVKDEEEIVTPQDVVVEYNFVEPEAPFTITLEDDGVFNVTGPAIKRLFDKLDVSTDANARLFAKKLRTMGVDEALRKKGVKNGDTVRILNYEFEFID
ncbi:MAG: GTPase ObgE [Bacilli bacterium]|nr:GTPase ObgE [Bacilli bacterium]